ncbi:MAG: hypothetical protein M3Q06_08110, partial [Bacteroidota bacterium]|nr:hypothetical protein [Bacteroidota bacterium]
MAKGANGFWRNATHRYTSFGALWDGTWQFRPTNAKLYQEHCMAFFRLVFCALTSPIPSQALPGALIVNQYKDWCKTRIFNCLCLLFLLVFKFIMPLFF